MNWKLRDEYKLEYLNLGNDISAFNLEVLARTETLNTGREKQA